MALKIMSATTSSSTSSFGCIDNFPKPPLSVHMRPLKSSISNSTNNLLPPLNSYPPMAHSEIDLKYIPIDPHYLPQCRPSLPFRLGEDDSRMGAGTWYIGIMARDQHLLTLHYIKTAHYRITRNPPHWTTSLIWRHVMSWSDAQGLEEQHGCCGKKSFYCSEPALLNDDDNDEEETLGEYVQSAKQLKKIRRWVEMPNKKDPMDTITRTSFPLILMGFSMTHSHMTNRHSSISSNSGTWFNSFINLFPLITYHSHDESQVLSYCHPFLLLGLLFLCCIINFPMAVLLCLLRLRIMTHFWLIFDSHYSPCW